MAVYFWIGQTPTTAKGVKPFAWNDVENWRTAKDISATQKAIEINQTTPGRTPGANLGVVDTVYIGYPVYWVSGGNKVNITARSPLLFGGCTGNVNIGSLTGGMTWENGNTFPVLFNIGKGNSDADADKFDNTDYTFNTFYPYPVVGGGLTGGNGYFGSLNDLKAWVKNKWSFTDDNINTIFSANNLAAAPNRQQLKIKATEVIEKFNLDPSVSGFEPLTVSMSIPRTIAKGTTGPACTVYRRMANYCRTNLHNSILLQVNNNASRRFGVDPITGEIKPSEVTYNTLVINSSILNAYSGYFDDSINIRANCFVSTAEVKPPVYVDSTTGDARVVVESFNQYFGGKYGYHYTGTTLGLSGAIALTDGKLIINSAGDRRYGTNYNQMFTVNVGQNGGVTSYFSEINATHQTVAFSGPVIVNSYITDNCYTVSDTTTRTTVDPVQFRTYLMKNNSKLDLTHNPNFDLWYFGSLEGNTVDGGIFTNDDTSLILGSPGVRFYNETVVPYTGLSGRPGVPPTKRTGGFNGTMNSSEVRTTNVNNNVAL
jgi:hypothetical protein